MALRVLQHPVPTVALIQSAIPSCRLAIPFTPVGLPIAEDGRLAIPFTPQTVNNIFGIAQLSCAGDTLVHA